VQARRRLQDGNGEMGKDYLQWTILYCGMLRYAEAESLFYNCRNDG
jgi:hypothetical protein